MRFSKGEVRDKVLREPPLDGDLSVSQPIPAAIAPSFLPQTSLYLLCKSTPIIYIESGASSSTSFIACFETPLLQEPLNSNNNSLKLASNKTSSSSCASGMPLSADAFNSLQYSNKQIAIRDSRFGLHLQLSRTELRDLDFLYTSWETMREKERTVRVKPDYMKRLPSFNPEMRFLVVEWLCDSACDLRFHRQTFYLAVNYLDRYLSECESFDGGEEIQWLGAACLLLGSKMEETVLNEAEHFVAFDWEGDDVYSMNLSLEERKRNSVNKLLEWEDRILEALDWDLRVPTAYEWLMHYFQNAALTKPEYYMDSSTDGCRIVKRRFEVNNFLKAAKRLDIFISDYESLVYENSLLAAIVFAEQAILLFMQRNESDQDAMEFSEMITGYKINPEEIEFPMKYSTFEALNDFGDASCVDCVDIQVAGLDNNTVRESADDNAYATDYVQVNWDFEEEG